MLFLFQEKGKGRRYFADDFDFGDNFEEYHQDPWDDVQKYLKKKRLSCTDQKIAQVRDENRLKVRLRVAGSISKAVTIPSTVQSSDELGGGRGDSYHIVLLQFFPCNFDGHNVP